MDKVEREKLIARYYNCLNCSPIIGDFVVYHKDEVSRHAHCSWCGSPVTETGKTKIIKDDYIMTLHHGIEVVEVNRRLAPFAKFKKEKESN